MACFSLAWLEQVLIWFVIVCFVVAVVRLLIPAILSWGGPPPPAAGTVMTILGWLVWTVIAIFVIYFIFDLLACAMGNGGLSLPPLRR